MLDKPESREQATAHLRAMSGRRHDLVSAAVIAENGRPVWRVVDRAKMFVRPLSEAFIADYLDAEWPAISGCVGCYRIEGPGAQLFSRIEGSQFTVLGMPRSEEQTSELQSLLRITYAVFCLKKKTNHNICDNT